MESNSKQLFQKLNKKVPYVLAAGNHDMGSADGKFADVRNSTLFNQVFPLCTNGKTDRLLQAC